MNLGLLRSLFRCSAYSTRYAAESLQNVLKTCALVPRLGLDAVGRLGDGPELPDIVDLPDPHPLADVVVPGKSRRNPAV